jgi:hypothetical protein
MFEVIEFIPFYSVICLIWTFKRIFTEQHHFYEATATGEKIYAATAVSTPVAGDSGSGPGSGLNT